MAQDDIALMAHLLRRAGFGATRGEVESYVAKGYEATVEELLHPENSPGQEDEDIVRRYHVDARALRTNFAASRYWMYRMINTKRPLEEKLALFWHGIFATGAFKTNHPKMGLKQIEMFRHYGMGSFRTLLLELSKDPAMLYYLDNKDNHGDAVNENYGRELLELFSMGVGNYTEGDVRQASRAFTGWTIANAAYMTRKVERNSTWPYGRLDWQFEYREDDHDDGEKTFLGHTGRLNGEDIIDIIVQQPAAARFIARHMYNFFVADEPQVPAWNTVPPRDPEAVEALADAFVKYEYDICSVLRVLFNSDFFKSTRFTKVKSPVELVVGTIRMARGYRLPEYEDVLSPMQAGFMGQAILDPPSVEGWHTGVEWLTTGTLVDRVNFVSRELADVDQPGVRSIIERITAQGQTLSPEALVDSCLDIMGPITLPESTKHELVSNASAGNGEARSSTERIREMLLLIAATREYQMA